MKSSKLIITTTSAKSPLIRSEWVQPGTHITAVGSDTHDKCELDYNILAKADLVVADSIEQNLTGVAVQDLVIAEAVFNALEVLN